MTPPTFSSAILTSWPEAFQIPWDQTPNDVRTAVANEKRQLPPVCRKMISILVDKMSQVKFIYLALFSNKALKALYTRKNITMIQKNKSNDINNPWDFTGKS
ncbi:hypothetical protein GOODEAATRI_031239 [Goodea atripinnis]|uniref:Uncharacterized protein n=1 Tax=Goodea atripinnis TaxID=208336 RepID=A0ABV0MM65_9TELE